VGTQCLFWWASGINHGGHPGFLLVGTWHFFWCAWGIFVATGHLNGHPLLLLVGTWHLGGHPEFLYVGTWFLLATWPVGVHLVFNLVASCHLGGHPVLFWVTTKHLGGHLASFQAPSISFHWHPAS